MSIRKATDWGRPEPVPDDAIFVNSDAEANEAVGASRREHRPAPPLCLLGGDLARTLGVADNEASLRAGEGTRLQIDLGTALIDGRLVWFVSHLVARRSWWRGPIVIAANAAFWGDYNVAPRAHPGRRPTRPHRGGSESPGAFQGPLQTALRHPCSPPADQDPPMPRGAAGTRPTHPRDRRRNQGRQCPEDEHPARARSAGRLDLNRARISPT